MTVLIALVVFFVIVFGLAFVGDRRRRGNRPGQSGALDNGMAGRHATGPTVTRNAGGQAPPNL